MCAHTYMCIHNVYSMYVSEYACKPAHVHIYICLIKKYIYIGFNWRIILFSPRGINFGASL